jgi:hypothetical protein
MFNPISAVTSLLSSNPLEAISGGGGLANIRSALDALMPNGGGAGGGGGLKADVLDDWCGTKPHPFPFPPPPPPFGGGLQGPGQLGNLIGELLGGSKDVHI